MNDLQANGSLPSDITILLAEYTELFKEIRNIHDKRILLLKILLTLMVGLLGYLTAGIILYVKSKGAVPSAIPASLVWCYSSIGLMLALGVYFFVHNTYYYYGPSKKHTVRYWKAIHVIRYAFKKLHPNIASFLVMPDSENYPKRPRLSKRWEQGIVIYPLYHLLFFFIFALLLSPLFAPVETGKGVVIPCKDLLIFKKSVTLLWPFLLIKLAIGGRTMRKYWENINIARIMTAKNIFPKERQLYGASEPTPAVDEPYLERSTKPTFLRKIVWWLQVLIVLFSIIILSMKGLDWVNSKYWLLFIVGTISASIIGEIAYLMTYNIKFDFSYENSQLKISFADISLPKNPE